MVDEKDRNSLQVQQLIEFIKEHDLHLAADPTEAFYVGKIFERDPLELKCRQVGDVTNYIEPPVSLPSPKTGTQGSITRNFRTTKQRNILISLVISAVSKILPASLSASFNSNMEKLLEANYLGIVYDSIDKADFGRLLGGRSLKADPLIFNPENEYWLATRVVKCSDLSVVIKVTSGSENKFEAKVEKDGIGGTVTVSFVKGTSDEVTISYKGPRPLVFGAHLERLVFDKQSAKITQLRAVVDPASIQALPSNDNADIDPNMILKFD
jgi:hypothetical protein